jgi:hypothetical protein
MLGGLARRRPLREGSTGATLMQHALSTTTPEEYIILSEECRQRAIYAIDHFVRVSNTQLADLYQGLAEHLLGSLALWIRMIPTDPSPSSGDDNSDFANQSHD